MTTTVQPTVTPVVCQRCGCQSTLTPLFQKVWNGLLCPACAAQRELHKAQILYGAVLLLLGVMILGGWLLTGLLWPLGVMLLQTFYLSFILILLHELSHIAAGWLLGGCVFGLHLGMGRLLLQRWLGNFYVGVSLLPASGICFVGFPPGKGTRVRFGLTVLAGPLFHLLLALLLMSDLHDSLGLPEDGWILPFFFLNWLMLSLNLWPWLKVQTAMGVAQGDGAQLWQLLCGRITTEQLQQNYYHLAASFALQQRQEAKALAEITDGLARYPANPLLRQLHGYLLLRQQRVVESLALWQAQLAEAPTADVPPVMLEYVDRAFAMTPWLTPVRGTLAASQVARGDYASGIALALAVAEEHGKLHHPLAQEDRAANLATAAIGYHQQGNAAEARRLLAEAQTLAPQDLVVQQAVAMMEGLAFLGVWRGCK